MDAAPPMNLAVGAARTVLTDGERETVVELHEMLLAPGSCQAIVGPNGCGKSTAMEMLAFARQPSHASHICTFTDQADPTSFDHLTDRVLGGNEEQLANIRRSQFGFCVQTNLLLDFLNVGDNIALSQRLSGRTDEALLADVIDWVEIGDKLNAMPRDLSVGQRQRAAIARAFVHAPSFILLDEPTSALDPDLSRKLLSSIPGRAQRFGHAVVMITHDMEAALAAGFHPVPRETVIEGKNMKTRFGPSPAHQIYDHHSSEVA